MKSIKILITIFLGTFVLNSCSDFLDSDPLTSLVETTFYKTEDDADLALVGCFNGMQTIYTQSDLPSLVGPSIMSDECFGGGGTGDGVDLPLIDAFDYELDPSIIDINNEIWVYSYKAIYYCNMLLSKLDQIEWETEGKREIVEAEVLFMRGYIYFELVKLLGNIPLVTTLLTPEEANVPQDAPEDVFRQIEEDILFACDNAYLKDETWTSSWATSNDGHVTVYAAKTLLARVFLFYTGYYNTQTLPGGTTKDDVITALTDVYNNSGHSLVDNYNELWPAACSERDASVEPIGLTTTYAGEGNSETVWAIKFNSSGEWGYLDGFRPMRIIGIRSGSVSSFGTTVYGDGAWGGCPVSPKFVSEWNEEEATDPRLNWSVIDSDAEGISYSSQHDQRELTGYWPKKYVCLGNGSESIYAAQSLDFQWNQYTDFVVMRYADVLLMLSELTEDATYMNEVRDRVGLDPISYSVDALRLERKHEFAFEGIRYWDMLRYDYTLEYAANAITETATVINGGKDTGTELSIDGAFLKACKGLSQIPTEQITLSGDVLKQNDGWSNSSE